MNVNIIAGVIGVWGTEAMCTTDGTPAGRHPEFPPYPELLRMCVGTAAEISADIDDVGPQSPELRGVPVAIAGYHRPFRLPADHPRFTYLHVLLAYAGYHRYPLGITLDAERRAILDAAWIESGTDPDPQR